MNVWGENLKFTIFGESHGAAIGGIIDGLPAGERIDPDYIAEQMKRRSPGNSEFSTTRHEPDMVEILSGIKDNMTTGAPICGIIKNTDVRSKDYDLSLLRPGHADWTAFLKYHGFADMRGGGVFSGRLTAPLVFAGSVARRILENRGISIAGMFDVSEESMRNAKREGDSIGGIVTVTAAGIPAGLGGMFFAAAESRIASLMFAIPAVKGVSFGAGFDFAGMNGSTANDPICFKNGKIISKTNNNGGILGGISTGMPIVVNLAIKPTPSIAKPQRTVNINEMCESEIIVRGRHDVCIVPRVMPVAESALALCVMDMFLEDFQ